MSEKSSVFVSESISDIIDMDQFFDSPGDVENVSVEMTSGNNSIKCIVDSVGFSESEIRFTVTCNSLKASQLIFGSNIDSLKFKSSTSVLKELDITVVDKSMSITESNNYKCKFIAKLPML